VQIRPKYSTNIAFSFRRMKWYDTKNKLAADYLRHLVSLVRLKIKQKSNNHRLEPTSMEDHLEASPLFQIVGLIFAENTQNGNLNASHSTNQAVELSHLYWNKTIFWVIVKKLHYENHRFEVYTFLNDNF